MIEYNSRFGDPETQVVLPLMDKRPCIEIMDAIVDGRLSEVDVKFSGKHAAVIVMASGGYPVKIPKRL